jgi:ATP-dependent DNA ligase
MIKSNKISEIINNDDGSLTIKYYEDVSRYESNGIIASLVSIGDKKLAGEDITKEIAKLKKKHNVDYEAALNSIVYTVWDMITVDEYFDQKSDMEYVLRRFNLYNVIYDQIKPENIRIAVSKPVETYEEAVAHFNECLSKGHEGTILKSVDGKWKNGKPNWQVKMKLEMDVDLKITGFNYGTGKNAELISSVNAESCCGQVVTSPTGIEEDMMKFITENQEKLRNTILEVKCSGLSKDSKGQYSLLHPVFKKLRDDKNDANSLEEIISIENMIKGLN